jgi:Arc/MetJ family transcription regulator
MHMKRRYLALREDLLEEAVRVSGAKTYSAAVNAALQEFLRTRKILSLPSLFNKGLWHGDLAEMREDSPRRKARKRKRNRKP